MIPSARQKPATCGNSSPGVRIVIEYSFF
jgi:hypothetical protein